MRLFAIGESLIDFFPHNNSFIPFVGGAPANVAACFARLGGEAYFIGKTGDDFFGATIIETLEKSNVKTRYLTKTNKANTALSFVSLSDKGERSFLFYRNPSADMFLTEDDISAIRYKKDDILHFGSISLLDMPAKRATELALNRIKDSGGTVSFDPNVRENLAKDLDKYRDVVLYFMKYADIIKMSSEDFEFLYQNCHYDKIAFSLLEKAHTVLLTFGDKGSRCYTHEGLYSQKAYQVECVDTTGAGDSFMGTFLRYFNKDSKKSLQLALKNASACSAIVCSKKGVIVSLPDEKSLKAFTKSIL